MSLQPLFYNDPFFTLYAPSQQHHRRDGNRGNSPLQNLLNAARPAIDLHEEDDKYIVEAEVPGVQRENIDVHVGDNGKSVTISGKTFARRSWKSGDNERSQSPESGAPTATGAGSAPQGAGKTVARKSEGSLSNTLSSERSFVGSSTFSRTVWLPQAADGSKVSAKLADGILTLTLPKLQDRESVRVAVE